MYWLLLIFIGLLVAARTGTSDVPTGTSDVPVYVVRIAQAIARAEGWYVDDSLPRRRNNPGSIVSGGSLVQYSSEEAGWQALYRQIQTMLSGQSLYYSLDMTLEQIAMIYTGNDKPDAWARIVAGQLGVSTDIIWGTLPEVLS